MFGIVVIAVPRVFLDAQLPAEGGICNPFFVERLEIAGSFQLQRFRDFFLECLAQRGSRDAGESQFCQRDAPARIQVLLVES